MIIGIDGNEANVERRVGIGEYAYELLCQFYKITSARKDLKFKIYLKNSPRVEMPIPTESWQYQIVGPKKFWTQIGLPLKLFTETKKPNVFFSPSHYAPRFSPVPTAISIMDLSYIHFPELFTKHDLYQLINWTKYSVKKARKIFTISQFSKNDIIRTYGRKSEDVVITHLGIKMEAQSLKHRTQNSNDKFAIDGEYILFVGTLQPRKNVAKLIEAFSKIKDKKIKLVIVGKKGWLWEEIIQAPEKFGVSGRVKFLDFVQDQDLPDLYKNATCFVLPSLYEGFGLPVLEAMKYGCPTVISDVSSLPEVGGDAAVYFDPQSVDDIAGKLDTVISDEKLRDEMIKKGYNQIKKFSWEKAARKTLDVLEEMGK